MSDAVNHDPKVKVGLLIDVPVPGTPGQRGGDMILATDDGPSGALYVGKNNSAGFLRIAGAPAGSNPIESNGSVPLTADWNAGAFEITAQAFTAVDENAKEMLEADAAAATRTITATDDNNVVMEQVSTKAGVRTKILTDAANKILAKITTTAARTFEFFDDAAVPTVFAKLTATVAGLRRLQILDEAGITLVDVFSTVATRSTFFRDTANRVVMSISGIAGAGSRLVQIADQQPQAMRVYATMTAERTIQDFTDNGVQMMLATMLAATKNYLFGAGGAAPSLKIDLNGTQLKLASTGATPAADGTIVGRWDLSNGALTIGPAAPNNAAILEVQSTTKGVRFGNCTSAQKNAIGNAAGNVVFDTDLGKLCMNSGAGWQTITSI